MMPKADRPESFSYIPALDGFRGLAVALVFLFHAKILPFGWMGVQFFFVLSGFLITAILVRDRQKAVSHGQLLRIFFIRRALRIWPLYFLSVGLLFLYSLITVGKGINSAFPYLMTFSFNWLLAVGYRWHGLYSHLWSISVEEHLYLIWGLLFIFFKPHRFFWLLLILVCMGAPFRYAADLAFQSVVLKSDFPTLLGFDTAPSKFSEQYFKGLFIYLSTFSHIDAFAIGGLVAWFYLFKRKALEVGVRWLLPLVFCLWLSLGILWPIFSGVDANRLFAKFYPLHMRGSSQMIWGYSSINIFAAAIIAFVVTNPLAQVSKFLCSRALVLLGKISFGFYVVHSPILVLIAQEWLVYWWGIPAWFLLSVAVSSFSYFLFERYFLSLKEKFQQKSPSGKSV